MAWWSICVANNKCDDFLPPLVAGSTNNVRFIDIGVANQDFLYFARINVRSPTDDDVFCAIGEGKKTFLIDKADIAGAQPTVNKRFGSGRWIAPVAQHNGRAFG